MTKQKTKENDAQNSHDQSDRDEKPPATDEGNESQSPPLPDASQMVNEYGDLDLIGVDEGDMDLEDKTSDTQLPNFSHSLQTPAARTLESKPGKRRERTCGKTSYCGVISKLIKTPKEAARKKGNFRCPICCSRFTRRESVNYHFSACVKKHGNPNGYHWDSHPSCNNSDIREVEVGIGSASFAACDHQEEEATDEEDVDSDIRYDPTTIASDILRVLGEHPFLPPLNPHLEGYDLASKPLTPPRVRLSLRAPRSPTEAIHATSLPQTVHRQHGGDDVEMVGEEKNSAPAEGKVYEGMEDVKRNTRVKAKERVNPTIHSRSSQYFPSQGLEGNISSSRARQVAQPEASLREWRRWQFPNGPVYFENLETGVVTLDDRMGAAFGRYSHWVASIFREPQH